LDFSCVYLMKLRFLCLRILGLPNKKMNNPEVNVHRAVPGRPYGVDKSDFVEDLLFAGSWNAYCLAETSDKFVF